MASYHAYSDMFNGLSDRPFRTDALDESGSLPPACSVTNARQLLTRQARKVRSVAEVRGRSRWAGPNSANAANAANAATRCVDAPGWVGANAANAAMLQIVQMLQMLPRPRGKRDLRNGRITTYEATPLVAFRGDRTATKGVPDRT